MTDLLFTLKKHPHINKLAAVTRVKFQFCHKNLTVVRNLDLTVFVIAFENKFGLRKNNHIL